MAYLHGYLTSHMATLSAISRYSYLLKEGTVFFLENHHYDPPLDSATGDDPGLDVADCTGVLASFESLDLKYDSQFIVKIPEGTKFNFFPLTSNTSGQCPDYGQEMITTDPNSILYYNHDTKSFTVPQSGIQLRVPLELVVILQYYFHPGPIEPQNPLSRQLIHSYLATEYQSILPSRDIHVYIAVIPATTYSEVSQEKLIGLNVKISGTVSITTTNVQIKLQHYYNTIASGQEMYKVLPSPSVVTTTH